MEITNLETIMAKVIMPIMAAVAAAVEVVVMIATMVEDTMWVAEAAAATAAAGTAAAATRVVTEGDTPEVTDQATIEMGGIEMVDMGKHHIFDIFFPRLLLYKLQTWVFVTPNNWSTNRVSWKCFCIFSTTYFFSYIVLITVELRVKL